MKSTLLMSFFLITVAPFASAVDLELKCKNNRLVSAEVIENEKSKRACDHFTSHGLTCFDTSKKLASSKTMSFFMPVDTVYQNRSSNQVVREDLAELVELSLQNGVDPYVVTAVKFIESPSIPNTSYYPRIFGLLPTDAIAAQSSMGCVKNNNSLEKQSDKKKETFTLPNADSTGTVCLLNGPPETADNPVLSFADSSSQIFVEKEIPLRNKGVAESDVGSYASKYKIEDIILAKHLFLEERAKSIHQNPKGCCIQVKYSSKEDPKKLFTHFRSLLGVKYIKEKTEKMPKPIASRARNDREKAAFAVQSFNGYGKLNVTERVNNKCLSGLNMGQKPLYGAGAMDLVTNLFLVNSGFNEIVEEKKRKLGLDSVPFYLCREKTGPLTIDSLEFAKLQKEYLSEQKDCPERSFDYFFPNSKKPSLTQKATAKK